MDLKTASSTSNGVLAGDWPAGMARINIEASATLERWIDMRRSEPERYRALVDGSIQGIMVDCNLRPVFANKAFARIHGYDSPAEILALKSSRQLYSSHGWDRVSKYYNALAAGGPAPGRYEVEGLRKDGHDIPDQPAAAE